MATSRRVGNYATSANAVIRNSDAIFDAAMSGKPDFTKISKEAIKGRSLERRAVTKAEADVASAGLKAFTDTNLTRMREDTKKEIADIKRPAKRMAGVVGGLGAIAGGYVMMEGNKKDKAERDELRGYRAELDRKNDERWEASEKRWETLVNSWKNGGGSSGDPKPSTPAPVSSGDSTPAPSGAGSTKPTKPIAVSSGGAITARSIADMAGAAGSKFPKLVAAQWALESGWGKKPSGTNNFFGIKATDSESSTSKPTWEVINGKRVDTSANFKNYDTPQGSVNDLVNKWYKDFGNYQGVNRAGSAAEAADLLVQENYATDPEYATKLKDIMSRFDF